MQSVSTFLFLYDLISCDCQVCAWGVKMVWARGGMRKKWKAQAQTKRMRTRFQMQIWVHFMPRRWPVSDLDTSKRNSGHTRKNEIMEHFSFFSPWTAFVSFSHVSHKFQSRRRPTMCVSAMAVTVSTFCFVWNIERNNNDTNDQWQMIYAFSYDVALKSREESTMDCIKM